MAQKLWDVVVMGGVNTDYLVRGSRLPSPGQTIEGNEFRVGPGGKGANQAVAAARLGAKVAFIGKVGSDERGGKLVRALEGEGIDVGLIFRSSRKPTGSALILVEEGGEKEIMAFSGANRDLTVREVRKAGGAIRAARIFLTQLEVPPDCVFKAVSIACAARRHVILDPAPVRPVADECLRKVALIRSNAGEAEVLTGVRVNGRPSARRAAEDLLRRGVNAAVIAVGDKGNLAVWKRQGGLAELWLPRFSVDAVDATGAGDAFSGALAAFLAEGKTLRKALLYANAAAALKTTKIGAQAGLPDRRAVLDMVREA